MKIISAVIFAFIIALFSGCNTVKSEKEIIVNTGTWLGELHLNDSTLLPFIYNVDFNDGRIVTIMNGSEKVVLETELENPDSLILNFPVYQTRLCIQNGEEVWLGYFEKLDSKEEYRIPFVGSFGFNDRLPNNEPACCALPERWKATFTEGEKQSNAIGEFKLEGNNLSGSFLTEYGDYRFLEGKLNGNQLNLYGFDGGYIQVFKGHLQNDSLYGQYFSGLTGYKTWFATPDETFELSDPDNISELNPEFDSICFSYPGIDGKSVDYAPTANYGKVTILQITGSWCPNCKDQGRYLQQLKNEFKDQGLQVLGIAFERMGTLEASIEAAKKSKEDLGTDYRVGIAKYNRDQVAEEEFPFLTKIKSYPTLIFIDKKGSVRKIHTGFSGPGTTKYNELTNGLTQFTKDLLNE